MRSAIARSCTRPAPSSLASTNLDVAVRFRLPILARRTPEWYLAQVIFSGHSVDFAGQWR